MTTTMDHQLAARAPEVGAPEPGTAPTWEDFHALEERQERREVRRDGWTLFIFGFAAIALIFSVVGIGFGSRAIDNAKRTVPAAAPVAAAPVAAAPVAAAQLVAVPAASPGPVSLSEYQVQTAATTVAAGKVTFQITNAGTIEHELLVFRTDLAPSAYPMTAGNITEDGPGMNKISDGDNIVPGATQTRTLDLTQPGTYLFVCNIAGHFTAGMHQVIIVK